MSLLSSFVTNQLLKALESEFISHEPDIQNAFANEVQVFASTIMNWANNKLTTSSTPSVASKS